MTFASTRTSPPAADAAGQALTFLVDDAFELFWRDESATSHAFDIRDGAGAFFWSRARTAGVDRLTNERADRRVASPRLSLEAASLLPADQHLHALRKHTHILHIERPALADAGQRKTPGVFARGVLSCHRDRS